MTIIKRREYGRDRDTSIVGRHPDYTIQISKPYLLGNLWFSDKYHSRIFRYHCLFDPNPFNISTQRDRFSSQRKGWLTFFSAPLAL